jgi:hypothetical protein
VARIQKSRIVRVPWTDEGQEIEQGRDFGDVDILGQFSLFEFLAAFANFEVTDQRPDIPRMPYI